VPTAAVSRRLLRARDYIDAHYAEPINVSDIARVAHQSNAHFARQFRHTFDETPHDYLLSRRLERASSLLRNTDYTVARICAMAGFMSTGSFTTLFGRIFGKTPGTYRKEHWPLLAQRVIPPCRLFAVERPKLSRVREHAA
jgi:AraC-like DNA-binding protein